MGKVFSVIIPILFASLLCRAQQPEEHVTLNELTVTSDRSATVKRLANGERFYLSAEARAMNDPFMALKEIPTIVSDPFNATVTTLDGNSPLVLVNGAELNSGIKPILPADIEYVEVIDAVPARYLARGVTSIINIQLRKNRPPYVWTELATRHEVPLGKGFGVGYFEVGNEKVSLYGRASANYTHHNDSEGHVAQQNSDYSQTYDLTTRSDGHSYLGELIFKYLPTPKDYLAVELYEKYDSESDRTARTGEFVSALRLPYSMVENGCNRSSVFTSSIYYRHDFSSSAQLEISGGYNNNWNRLEAEGREYFGPEVRANSLHYNNRRNSGNVSIDFMKIFANGNTLQAGSYTTMLRDRIGMLHQPVFHHSNYDEYVYAGFSGSAFNKLYYMLSGGVQARWLSAADYTNNYVRPRLTVSGTWQFDSHNSVQAYYTMSNSAPDAGKLNPYNTSTDSLTESRGNPALVPQTFHSVKATYTFNTGGFYASAAAGANFFRDVIVPAGYTDDRGVYVSTYMNLGRYHNYTAEANLSYRFSRGPLSGRVYGGVSYVRRYYTGLSPLGSFTYSGGFAAWWRKFYFGGDISATPRNYTDITTTRNLRPLMANVQVNYNITPNFYVAVCLQGFCGNSKSVVITDNGTFRSEASTTLLDSGLRPWILLRWNMRRNVRRKIKLENVLRSTETGIRLK